MTSFVISLGIYKLNKVKEVFLQQVPRSLHPFNGHHVPAKKEYITSNFPKLIASHFWRAAVNILINYQYSL